MGKRISITWWIIIGLVLIKLMAHFLTNTNYELHRDAFLYLAEGEHPAWGYWSEAPMVPFLGKIVRSVLGDSVFAIRLLPALVGAASIVLIGLMVRLLGGGAWAITLAGVAFFVSPAFLRSNTLFQPVSFDQFGWLLTTYFLIKLVKTKNPRYWLHLGVTCGVAFLVKYSIAFLVAAFLLALLFTAERRLLRSKYVLYGAGLGLLIILPNLIWQAQHHFPVVYHMTRLQATQLVNVRVVDFLGAQVLMNFPNLLIWLAGLIFLLFLKPGKTYRVVGYTYLLVLLIFIILRGKGYYALGIYPVLFMAGGVALEQFAIGPRRWLKLVMLGLMVVLTLPLLPYSLPVLRLDGMVAYGAASCNYGAEGALRWEDGRIYQLPQDYADMVGWQELAQIVIQTYQGLSATEKPRTVIFADNYGEAGSIKFYGQKYGLPEPVCFDGSFLFWAPDSTKLTTLIYVNDDTSDVAYYFDTVKQVGQITNPYARESGLPVFLCQGPRRGFHQFYAEKVRRLKNQYR